MKLWLSILMLLILFVPCSSFGEEENSLFAFVGEKISVEKSEPKFTGNEVLLDQAFTARYKVIESVYGSFSDKKIEFRVYDHYGVPAFSKYRYALLFVSKYEGKYYHEKYQYFDVYRTKNNRWASCGDPYKNEPEVHRKNLKARKIEFLETVSFDTNAMWKGNLKQNFPTSKLWKEVLKEIFPEEFFVHEGEKVICRGLGNYIEELFEVKKEGVLKARGLF